MIEEQKKLHKELRDNSNCFPLVNKCAEQMIFIPKEVFAIDDDYDYYIENMFYEITPFCGCWNNTIDKVNLYIGVLENEDTHNIYGTTDELLYSFLDEEEIREHWSSLWSWRRTTWKWDFILSFLKYYKGYLSENP